MQPKYFDWNRFLMVSTLICTQIAQFLNPQKKTKYVSQNTSVDFENLGIEIKTNQSHISCSGDGFSLK